MSPLPYEAVKDKILGAIVGGALGDAIGLYTEFMSAPFARSAYGANPRFNLVNLTPPRKEDSHRHGFEQGAWTDDTDQAILIILSFLAGSDKATSASPAERIDPQDFAHRLLDWTKNGLAPLNTAANDVGLTVNAVVNEPDFLKEPHKAAERVWARGGRKGAANGAVMRTSPIAPLLYKSTVDLNDDEAEKVVRDSALSIARVTHSDPRCQISSVVVTTLILAILRGQLLNGDMVDEHIARAFAHIHPYRGNRRPEDGGPTVQDRMQNLDEDLLSYTSTDKIKSFRDLRLDEAGKIGYTYKTLGAAILTLRQGVDRIAREGVKSSTTASMGTFESLITELIMCAGDADTNAQPAGALLGAVVGYSHLPSTWLDGLAHRDWLLRKVDQAMLAAGLVDPSAVLAADSYKPNLDKDLLLASGSRITQT